MKPVNESSNCDVGSGTKRMWPAWLMMSVPEGIVLQKSEKAQGLISRQRTKQATIAD
jgi:hypothetical protein